MGKCDLRPDMTIAEALATFRFRPGDVVAHKATGGIGVVLGRVIEDTEDGFGRVYSCRTTVRDERGRTSASGPSACYECELDPTTTQPTELAEAIDNAKELAVAAQDFDLAATLRECGERAKKASGGAA